MRFGTLLAGLYALALLGAPLGAPLSAQDSLSRMSQELDALVEKTQRAIVSIRGGVPGELNATGVIVDTQGTIITCARAIRRQGEVDVTLSDGTRFKGRIVARDAVNDLAVIQINGGALTALEIRSEPCLPGEVVMTVGNSFGSIDSDHQAAYSLGVVSDMYRLDDGYRGYVLETDSAINPGSYGGPLLDLKGRVVGLMNRAYKAEKWMGVCVPATQIAAVLPYLMAEADVRHGYLGLKLKEVEGGLEVTAILEDSPNAKRFQVGDILRRADQTDLTALGDLRNYLIGLGAGSRFPVTLTRQGQSLRLWAEVGLKAGGATLLPSQPAKDRAAGWSGVDFADSKQPKGAQVQSLVADGPAAKAGLLPGDVVVAAEGNPVQGARDLVRRLNSKKVGDVMALDVKRLNFDRRLYLVLGQEQAPVVVAPKKAGWLGLTFEANSARIEGLVDGGPAAKAGLRPGDRLIAIAGSALPRNARADLIQQRLAEAAEVGKPLGLRVLRGAQEVDVEVVPQEKPAETAVTPAPPKAPGTLGVTLQENPQWMALDVVELEAGGPAEKAGVRVGDSIFKIDGKEVGSIDALRQVLAGKSAGDAVEITLSRNRRVSRVSVTLGGAPSGPKEAGFLGLALTDALIVEEVLPNSPAAKAGLRPGDKLVQVAGRKPQNLEDFSKAMAHLGAGDALELEILRGRDNLKLRAVLGKRPAAAAPESTPPATPRPQRARLGVRLDGLNISELVVGEAAEAAGLKVGDAITFLDGVEIDTPDALMEALGAKKPGDKIKVGVLRGGVLVEVLVTLGPKNQAPAPAPAPTPVPQPPQPPRPTPPPAPPAPPSRPETPPQRPATPPQRPATPPSDRPTLGLRLEGLTVREVIGGSLAEKAGLKAQDRLMQVAGKPLSTPEELRPLLRDAKLGEVLVLQFARSIDLTLGDKDGKAILGVVFGEGAKIRRVAEGSLAQAAGVQADDTLLSIDGQAVASAEAVRTVLANKKPGQSVKIELSREVGIPWGVAPAPKPESAPKAEPAPAPKGTGLGFRADDKLVVQEVRPGSAAELAGIRVGDRIRNLDKEVVENLEDLRRVVSALKPGKEIKFVVERQGETVFGSLKLPESAPEGPKNTAIQDMPEPLVPGFLGVYLREVDGSVRIDNTIPGAAAEKLGLAAGDIFVAIGDLEVKSQADLIRCIKSIPSGQKMRFKIKRGDEILEFEVELGTRPNDS